MSNRCPNCHADLVGNKCPSCHIIWTLPWICPDCGTEYFTGGNGPMRFCPACRAKKAKLEQEYWDNKRVGLRSVSNDIVSQILANK